MGAAERWPTFEIDVVARDVRPVDAVLVGLIYGRYGRAGYGADVFYVFTTAVQTGMLGAVLALASSPFYNEYVQRFGGDVEVALADQQVAGLVMWIPAGILLTLVALRCLPPGSVKPSGRHAYGRTLP